ncbi:MAG: phage minor head protein [Desulfuromonadaceae bacterium]|nr:phage minor head protein [Desulfuromonadaceae bacterium]MDD2855333.1 phage minor head protein [Desulfuromonadaceae bacterium]
MTPEEYNRVFKLPFKEAESFFRNKLNIPTDKWDDLWKGQHAKGFMVAGAQKAELLSDFREAVQKAIDGKMTLKDFQGSFDEIVKKHGWSYNGSRNWRSELIYNTNVRSSYMAGRWQQLTEPGARQGARHAIVGARRAVPLLVYRHSDGVSRPRPLHVSWNGLTLPASHDFWKSHYPPNGWGCRCTVFAASEKEHREAIAAGKGEPPRGWTDQDAKTGAPVGIDKGWDYNVGQASEKGYEVLANKFEKLPTDIAKSWINEFVKQSPFERFIAGKIKGNFPVAVLDKTAREAIKAESQAVWLSDDSLLKNKGEQPKRSKGHPELTLNDYRLLPEIIGSPELVIEKEGYKIVAAKREGSIYMAVVKTTTGKDELYLVSYRKTNLRDIEAEKAGGNVIHDVLS